MAQQPDSLVTFVVTRMVKHGREAEYEAWIRGICMAVLPFAGFLGADVIRSGEQNHRTYEVIFRFDTHAHLMDWEDSDVRQEWLKQLSPLTEGETKVQRLTGLEYWFVTPDATGKMPSRHRQAFLSWLVIFPLQAAIFTLLAPLVNPLPVLMRTMIVSGIVIPLMTYLVMPRLTKWLARWLFEK
jgi:antibiotic biosynthesis monooxygenase (ABM) superfamily enzyme